MHEAETLAEGAMPSASGVEGSRSLFVALLAIIVGTFMAILDATVVNVAVPTIERAFNTDLQVIQWMITGYMLAQAAVIPLAGWLSDRFGAKRVYIVALVLFTMGSFLCALAASAQALIAFRVLQGLGGGMLWPIGMTFIYRLAPPERRGQVMSAFTVPSLLAPALGPVMSGWIVQYARWELIFLINLPVGVVAVLLGLRALPNLPAQGRVGRLDVPGMLLGPLGFAALSFGISESTVAGWSGASTLGGIGLGVLLLVAFTLRELSTLEPLLDLRVFRAGEFTRTMVTSWVGQTALFGTLFLVPIFLQQVRGLGPFDTGVATLPQAISSAILTLFSGRLFDRFGVKVPTIFGLAAIVGTFALLSRLTVGTTVLDLVLPLALWGVGLGLMLTPLNTHLLNSAPRNLLSRVTSLSSATSSVVGSLGVATFSTILQAQIMVRSALLGPGGTLGAMAGAYADTFTVAGVIALACIPLALTLNRKIDRTGS